MLKAMTRFAASAQSVHLASRLAPLTAVAVSEVFCGYLIRHDIDSERHPVFELRVNEVTLMTFTEEYIKAGEAISAATIEMMISALSKRLPEVNNRVENAIASAFLL